jgi:2,3-bisphosphoglycerate-dependent phosphoglycerate mutase
MRDWRRHADVHVVRHGQSTWNAQRRIQGQAPGIALTPLGQRQAGAAARRLAGCGARALYASDLTRAAATAAPIARQLGLTVTIDPDLRERGLGEYDGRRPPCGPPPGRSGATPAGGRPAVRASAT